MTDPAETKATRSGFVALIGAPNAGKSTLLNRLVGAKVSIVSHKVQTTRAIVRGIATHGSAQIVFVDTPGLNGTHGTQIELIEPLGPDSTLTGFLAKNPAGGQHHLCYEVEDIEDARKWFEDMGKRILGPTRIGAHGTPIFFVHPKDMQGMLTEIMETPAGDH